MESIIMKAPAIFVKTGRGLVPASVWAEDWYAKIRIGEEVIVDPKKPRNPGNHRRFWALLTIIADNLDGVDSPWRALDVLCAVLGRGKWIEVPRATKPLFVRDSIAYANMDETEFGKLFEQCIHATIKYLVPADRRDLEEEIARF